MTVPDRLVGLAEGIRDPADYYEGMPDTCVSLPRNILQFIRRDQPQPEVSFHHRFVMIAALREPGGVILDGEVVQVEQGQGVLIFPFQSHHFTPFADPRHVRWLFTTFEHSEPDFVDSLRNTPFAFGRRDMERLLWVTEAFVAWRRSAGNAPVEHAALLALLLGGLVEGRRRGMAKAAASRRAAEVEQPLVARISRHVYSCVGRRIPMAELAGLAALSPSRLRARFRKAVGVPVGLFIRRTRIHRACGLLCSTGMSITEVSEACGFESLYSFSRAFKQVMASSPRAYRAKLSAREGIRHPRRASTTARSRNLTCGRATGWSSRVCRD